MTAIAFRPKAKLAALVCRESVEKGLHKPPDERSGCDCGRGFIIAVTEAGANRLVHIEHVLGNFLLSCLGYLETNSSRTGLLRNYSKSMGLGRAHHYH